MIAIRCKARDLLRLLDEWRGPVAVEDVDEVTVEKIERRRARKERRQTSWQD